MVDRFIDTGGIVHDHRLSNLSLHDVLLLEMLFCHGYCLFVLYPHPSDLSMSVGNNIIGAFRDLIISIGHNTITYLSYTITLCCPCYNMPKYVPRLEGIMHDPEGEGECIMPSNLGTYFGI
jgi:hypothetical protein